MAKSEFDIRPHDEFCFNGYSMCPGLIDSSRPGKKGCSIFGCDELTYNGPMPRRCVDCLERLKSMQIVIEVEEK